MRLVIAVSMMVLAGPAGALAQGARLQLGHLDRLASSADEAVDIAVDPAMLKLASAFLKAEGEQALVKELLEGIEAIYVRSFEFAREDAYTPDDVETIRKQLTGARWSRLARVDSKRDRELVEIYSWREGKESGGMAILVAEPTELTVVNIVGLLDFEKLQALQGSFGIPSLPGLTPSPDRQQTPSPDEQQTAPPAR